MRMDVNEAVKTAAQYVVSLESLSNEDLKSDFYIALNRLRFAVEGTHYNSKNSTWCIEVGFTRKWDQATRNAFAGISGACEASGDNRTIKQVVISDKTGKVISYGD